VGNEAAVHNNVGTALRKKGDLEGAVRAYGEAIAADPRQPLLRYNLARVWEDMARPDQALRAYQAAVELDPGLHAAYVRLSKLQLKSSPADSLRTARAAVALRPQVCMASPAVRC
jgi:tetratricopeptide (TPR) repeat protein